MDLRPRFIGALVIAMTCLVVVRSEVAAPTQTNYQGQLRSNGTLFTGTASMKFAIVDGATWLWSNDSTGSATTPPTASVSVPVSNGLFTAMLGATPMRSLGLAVFATAAAPVLRVWVNTGGAWEQLSDQPLGSAPFTLQGGTNGGAESWATSGADIYRASGHVGIGTTNPVFPLTVGYGGTVGPVLGIDPVGITPDLGAIRFGDNSGWKLHIGRGRESPDGPLNTGSTGAVLTIIDKGYVGIGTTTPVFPLTVGYGGTVGPVMGIDPVGITPDLGAIRFGDNSGWKLHIGRGRESPDGPLNTGSTGAVLTIIDKGYVGIGTTAPSSPLTVVGTTTTSVLEITGGSDLAEPFNVSRAPDEGNIRPGMVVSIDPDQTGRLRLASRPYDPTVAGVLSGANGLSPGLVMKSSGRPESDGSHPVALSGRVWCWTDASFGSVHPGDLLTTSSTPGMAMVATDSVRRQGAILGKAMSSLERGRGLVLVLVSLQ